MTTWRVPYPKFGSTPTLPRVTRLAEQLGIDLASFGAEGAVVVGSNGKGSTAAMVAALLAQTGADVGLFTSPHLWRLNERLRLNGRDIEDVELEPHWRRVRAVADAYMAEHNEQVGAFEFLFLVAADWFATRGARYTVWEAGIGGRMDPVRLIAARRVGLASLDLEHAALLGDTLEEIARDKLDAAPPGAKAFIAAGCAPQRAAIEAHCAQRGVEASFIEEASLEDLAPPLAGAHQRSNAALALAIARDMASLTRAQLSDGFAATRWPGRLEVLGRAPLLVIDVCHTPRAAQAARAGFDAMHGTGPKTLICGVSLGKDAPGVIGALAPGFELILCTQASHNATPAETVALLAREANPAAVVACVPALEEARRRALTASQGLFVAGGLFLAAEFRALHMGIDPQGLSHL
jgi:dihydrofolate synthase/folylpolyglutamate synthase